MYKELKNFTLPTRGGVSSFFSEWSVLLIPKTNFIQIKGHISRVKGNSSSSKIASIPPVRFSVGKLFYIQIVSLCARWGIVSVCLLQEEILHGQSFKINAMKFCHVPLTILNTKIIIKERFSL